jgi:hypothetical protein
MCVRCCDCHRNKGSDSCTVTGKLIKWALILMRLCDVCGDIFVRTNLHACVTAACQGG